MTSRLRQQPGLACEPCRRRKARCDRSQPVCGACAETGAECVVNESRPQRGPKKGQLRALRTEVGELTLFPLADWLVVYALLPVPRLCRRRSSWPLLFGRHLLRNCAYTLIRCACRDTQTTAGRTSRQGARASGLPRSGWTLWAANAG